VLRLHFGQRGRSGLAEKLAKSASTDPQTLLSHSKPLNKRNNFRMRGRLLPLCYPVRQGALSCGVAAAALVAHRHSKPPSSEADTQVGGGKASGRRP